ncbi:MAG: hypothetical protein QW655_05355 [Nitrososphaerota archaeon]
MHNSFPLFMQSLAVFRSALACLSQLKPSSKIIHREALLDL